MLLVRINLVLVAVLALAGLMLGLVGSAVLRANAEREVLSQVQLMLDSALATRAYTANEIDPLLVDQMTTRFLPQSVPFYAATQNFLKLREQHPDYEYKEATLNPTNPRDRATDWEADIIQRFRNDAAIPEIQGQRDTPTGRSLYVARPIRADAGCLSCHGLASAAPATLVARYGRDNGFGWQTNEVVGAQIVSAPTADAIANAERILRGFLVWLVLDLVAIWVAVNATLYLWVSRPLRRLSRLADQVSTGDMTAAELPEDGGGEIGALARSYNRLRRSLAKALALLDS